MEPKAKHKQIDIAKIWLILKNNKKIISLISLVATLIAIIYCIFATPIFTAKATINPPKLTDAGAGMNQQFLGIGGALTGGGGGLLAQKTDSDITLAIFDTNILKDIIIKKFNLINYYKKKDIELTRRALSASVQFIPNLKSGFIEIDVNDKDPKLAMQIANYYSVALGQVISNIAYSRSQQKTQFFNNQLNDAKSNLTASENNLKAFLKANGIIASVQSSVIVGVVTQLQSQLVVAQTQLKAMSYYASPDNPDYKTLQAQISSYKEQLNKLNSQGNDEDKDIAIPAGLAPDLTQQYVGLTREFMLREEIYKILLRQYEVNKMDVLSEVTPTAIGIVDPAQIPLYKSKPKRLYIIVGWFILGFILSCLYVLVKNRKEIFTIE